MKIKSHVISLVLRNGGYTVSNPGFCAVSFRQFCTGRGLARHLNANVYTLETAMSCSQNNPVPRQGKEQKGQLLTIRRNASISICQTLTSFVIQHISFQTIYFWQIKMFLLIYCIMSNYNLQTIAFTQQFRFLDLTINDGSIEIIFFFFFLIFLLNRRNNILH